MAFGRVAPETDVEIEVRARMRFERPLYLAIEVRANDGGQIFPHVLDRLDIRNRVVAARRRQQRDVVAATLVPVRAAKIDDLCLRELAVALLGQIGARGDDVDPGDVGRQLTAIVDDEEHFHDGSLADR